MSLNKFTDVDTGYGLGLDIGADEMKCNSLNVNGKTVIGQQFSNTVPITVNFAGPGTYPVITNQPILTTNLSQYVLETTWLSGINFVFANSFKFVCDINGTQLGTGLVIPSWSANYPIKFTANINVQSGSGTVNGLMGIHYTLTYKNDAGIYVDDQNITSGIVVNLSTASLLSCNIISTEVNVFTLGKRLNSIVCLYQ